MEIWMRELLQSILCSDKVMQTTLSDIKGDPRFQSAERHGPSVEVTIPLCDLLSKPGVDHVFSIHCSFWPKEAAEWVQRPRCGWPTFQTISSIVNFGFHLVPVGHPLSKNNLNEWRISFSIAERTLVWSFNHVQIQCYALMKILLKEFIKVRCNPQNQVLCSYFIKTFLFWKFESTDLNFWCAEKIRECMKYLLSEFTKCIRNGVLRHYFIPRFNLLSIKLTQAAQTELLQLLDIIIQSDISILRECRTLQKIWSKFLQAHDDRNKINDICNSKQRNMQRNDKYIRIYLNLLNDTVAIDVLQNGLHASRLDLYCKGFHQIMTLSCKSHLKPLVLKSFLSKMLIKQLVHKSGSRNKDLYQLYRLAQNDTWSYDISTCKLMCAILLHKKGDYSSTLNIINQVLSSIPPYVLYETHSSNEEKQLYVKMFLDSDLTPIERAREAWMLDLTIVEDTIHTMPLAIQTELYFVGYFRFIMLSPFTCSYYLQFLCHHQMQQYENRDHALQQLVEVVNNPTQSGMPYTSLNIVGHCLLLAGKTSQARDIFCRSYLYTQMYPQLDNLNSALWYLLNFF